MYSFIMSQCIIPLTTNKYCLFIMCFLMMNPKPKQNVGHNCNWDSIVKDFFILFYSLQSNRNILMDHAWIMSSTCRLFWLKTRMMCYTLSFFTLSYLQQPQAPVGHLEKELMVKYSKEISLCLVKLYEGTTLLWHSDLQVPPKSGGLFLWLSTQKMYVTYCTTKPWL